MFELFRAPPWRNLVNKSVRSMARFVARFRGRSAATLLAVVVAGAAGAFGAHGSAAAAPEGGAWPASVIHPAVTSCPRGEKLITPTSGWTDTRGVSHLTYKSVPGLVTSLPPRGLKEGTVTPALLTDLGVRTAAITGAGAQRAVIR
jgi:hypothetical protein